MWKFKKWQYIRSTGERTQQLEYVFITEEQKSTSVHIEGITEWKKRRVFVVLQEGMYQSPGCWLRNLFLRDLLFPHCASMPFDATTLSSKIELVDKRFDLLMERQTAVIIVVYFPLPSMQLSPKESDFCWTLNKYIFKPWTISSVYCSFLPLFSVA